MKHISLLSFLIGLSVSALAQETVIDTSYYTLPVHRRRVLTEDPDERNTPSYQPVKSRRNVDAITGRSVREIQSWYVNLEGGFRNDASELSNSFNGLISSSSKTKAVWSVLLGYTYRNAWTVETGYAYAPIHLNITVANGSTPLVYNYQNGGYGLPLRIKRRIGSGNKAANGTGFWVSAGAWLVPNGDAQLNNFRLIGYSYRTSRSRTADTLRLNSNTTLRETTGLAELGADYSVRLASFLEFGVYLRKYWGIGKALRSDLAYRVNQTEQQALVTSDGKGWSFGISLRYIYGRQQEVKH
ncbi:hypothetical protein GCM10028807_21380 [Spirosoma daeguense]